MRRNDTCKHGALLTEPCDDCGTIPLPAPPPDTKVPHDRPGLYLCCMRTAEKYYDQNARYGIEVGLVITCDNAKCGQPIEYIGGGWKHADAKH